MEGNFVIVETDWLKTFQCIKEVIVAVCAVSAVVVAYLGLKSWRKQLKGKVEYELARRLLKAVYKLRNGISTHVIHPLFAWPRIAGVES